MMSEPDLECHIEYVKKNWNKDPDYKKKNADYWKGYKAALKEVLEGG